MGDAFAWISDLITWVTNFIPRLVIIPKNMGGVKYVYGKKVKRMDPGIHMYWPVVTEIETIPVARQTQELDPQALMTKDGERITVRGVIVYTIYDVANALGNHYDISATIGDVAMTSIVYSVTSRGLNDLVRGVSNGVVDEITNQCKTDLREYGVAISKVALVDCSTCIAINNLGGSTSYIPEEEAEE